MKNKSFLITAAVFFFLFFMVVLMTSGTQGMLLDENIGYWASGFEDTSIMKVMKYISVLG